MKKIQFIVIGKTQDSYVQDGIAVFMQRLAPFCQATWHVSKPANYVTTTKKLALEQEAKQIRSFINPRDFTFICDEKGKSLTSIALAKTIEAKAIDGYSSLNFVIGGAFGIAPLLKQEGFLLSFSNMTFNHQLFRLLLIEQVYRSFTILQGSGYHHE